MIGASLRALRKAKNISQLKLAKELNLGRSTIAQYETGTRTPDYQTLLKLARYFSVSTDYLLGNMALKSGDDLLQGKLEEPTPGSNGIFFDQPGEYQASTKTGTPLEEVFFFRVKDDSMINARILAGDLAVVNRQTKCLNGDIVLVSIKNKQPGLKKLFFLNDTTLILQGENPQTKPLLLDKTEVKILGKVVEVRFKL